MLPLAYLKIRGFLTFHHVGQCSHEARGFLISLLILGCVISLLNITPSNTWSSAPQEKRSTITEWWTSLTMKKTLQSLQRIKTSSWWSKFQIFTKKHHPEFHFSTPRVSWSCLSGKKSQKIHKKINRSGTLQSESSPPWIFSTLAKRFTSISWNFGVFFPKLLDKPNLRVLKWNLQLRIRGRNFLGWVARVSKPLKFDSSSFTPSFPACHRSS